MDLRAKSVAVSKWLEWVLRFRWPILILFTLPILHFLQAKEGFVVSAFLGSIRTFGIFPWVSHNAELAQPWLQGQSWFAALPMLAWILVLSWRYSFRILAWSVLALLGLLGLSYMEYLPWLSIGGAAFFGAYALARLYTPAALLLAYLFALVLSMSVIQSVLEMLRLNTVNDLPLMLLAFVAIQAPLLDLCWQRFKSWQAGQQNREALVKSTQKIYTPVAFAALASLGTLVSYPAQNTGSAWYWVLAIALLSSSFCVGLALIWPAWFSTLPLADRRKKN